LPPLAACALGHAYTKNVGKGTSAGSDGPVVHGSSQCRRERFQAFAHLPDRESWGNQKTALLADIDLIKHKEDVYNIIKLPHEEMQAPDLVCCTAATSAIGMQTLPVFEAAKVLPCSRT